MRTLAQPIAAAGYARYARTWEQVALRGARASLALDAWQRGWRYLSLNALLLSDSQAADLAMLTERFGRLLDVATTCLLQDRAWWPELAWPWPALELAAQEPTHPRERATLYGRFDWLLDRRGVWRLVEYNADTPSGGRETGGFEIAAMPFLRRFEPSARRGTYGLARRLRAALSGRLRAFERQTGRDDNLIGVVSSHQWLEDMCSAWWLAGELRRAGWNTLVGDVTDLAEDGEAILLRGQPIQALYRFYPYERLYRRAAFGTLADAATGNRLLVLNGLRGFLAQSKATLAWLWEHRDDARLGPGAARLIERHLPATHLARTPAARRLLRGSVVKHVNGREGDSVVRGDALSAADWETRLADGGYVVQARVEQWPLDGLLVDDEQHALQVVSPHYACVGTFCVGGRFGGFYTRLDGPVTTARATYVPTLVAAAPAR